MLLGYPLRFVPVIESKWGRIVAGFGGMVLGFGFFSTFVNYILPAIMGFNEEVGYVVLFWIMFPAIAFVCLGLALAMSGENRRQLGFLSPLTS